MHTKRNGTSDNAQAENEEPETARRDEELEAERLDDPATQGARVDQISDDRLVQLFSQPRSPKKLLAGLRVLGFSADSVQFMTEAKSRDVVYSWAADRARPGVAQAKRLDEIRRILYFICAHEELGADSAWMLFNARFANMDMNGPTTMELIAEGRAASAMSHLETLVDDESGDDGSDRIPDPGQPPEPSPTREPEPEPVETG